MDVTYLLISEQGNQRVYILFTGKVLIFFNLR